MNVTGRLAAHLGSEAVTTNVDRAFGNPTATDLSMAVAQFALGMPAGAVDSAARALTHGADVGHLNLGGIQVGDLNVGRALSLGGLLGPPGVVGSLAVDLAKSGALGDIAKSAGKALGDAFETVGEGISSFSDSLGNGISEVAESIGNGLSAAASAVGEALGIGEDGADTASTASGAANGSDTGGSETGETGGSETSSSETGGGSETGGSSESGGETGADK